MQIPITVDGSGTETLTRQLADQLRTAIRHGRVAPGARLPSSRRLAEQLAISRNTVVRAYEELEIEGWVETRPASGIFVAAELPDARNRPQLLPAALDAPPTAAARMPVPAAPRVQKLVAQGKGLSFDFFPGRASAELFPLKTWRRLLHAALSRGGAAGVSQYPDPAGLFQLRSAIASLLAATRAIVVDPGQIVIVAGVQQGIGIASRLLLAPGAAAIVEDPCYAGAAFAFEAAGATLRHVPVDEAGLVVEALPEAPAALLYTTPSHQYPLGHTLAMERRIALAAWARRTGGYILEDDYDGDFRYEGSPLRSVASIAPDCTIHLGTFSKSLGAGLRLGYMVVPAQLVDAVRATKTLLDNGNAWLEQAALAEFIRSGSYDAHLTRLRSRYRESRDALIVALQRNFGEAEISGEAAGLHLFWRLPPGVPEAATLEALGRRSRVGIYPPRAAGVHASGDGPLMRRSIVLGYAALGPRAIAQGIARLSDAVDDTLDTRPGLVDELIVQEPLRRREPLPRLRGPDPAPRNRQQPALRGPGRPKALSAGQPVPEESMPVVSGLYRYPVKGLSAEPVARAALEPGKPFPFDRVFALARPGVPIDRDDPQWAKKGLFVMLMLEEALAQVKTSMDEATSVLTIRDGNRELLSADASTEDGRAAIEDFVHRLVPTLRGAPQLVRSRLGHFMDKPDNVLSLINLATVRDLEQRWGTPIDPLRFRANVYIDGARPWEEFDWIGEDIAIGEVVLRVDRRNGRCGATNVNPATGRRDLDIPASLRAAFGHKDLGVYLVTKNAGRVAVGDFLRPPRSAAPPVAAKPVAERADARRYICRGCYFVYDEAQAGAPFADLRPDWRCPDCGTERGNFRPHVAAPATAAE